MYLTGIAILLIWLGFVIRLHNLGGDSMWTDEIQTMLDSHNGLAAAIDAPRDHPPLIYVLTSLSINAWGENEFAGRLPSFFAAVLTIPLIIILGKTLGHTWVGIWAALFLVFSPFHVKYSQEARHYSLLLLTSLASYTLLYKAMVKPRRSTWAAYAIFTTLMLYTHYAGFVVMITQTVIIAVWLIGRIQRRDFTIFSKFIPAVLLVAILYLPWLPRFLTAFFFNTSEDRLTGTGGSASLTVWLREAFTSFGMYYSWRPWFFLVLTIIGLLLWIRHRRWQPIAFICTSLILPFILIQIFDVSRGAFARYIIYLLPFYLLLAAAVPVFLLQWLSKNQPSKTYLAGMLVLALAFGFSSLKPVQYEYDYVQSDWKGILQYLDKNANEGDILLGLSLSQSNGFNAVYHDVPYYLERTGRSFQLLREDDYEVERLKSLPETGKNVYLILSNWDTPTQFQDPTLKVVPFSFYLYVVDDIDQDGPILDRIITYYEQTLTITTQPVAFCLLYRNLSALEAANGRFLQADDWLNAAREACNGLPDQIDKGVRGDTKEAIFDGLLDQMEQVNQNGETETARSLAHLLLTFDPKQEEALGLLTAENLQTLFEQGQATVEMNQAPEPVSVKEFVMPDTGDAGEVLFIHPPATAAFDLTLPETPVTFASRIALAPESWEWGGDGVTFVLRLETAEGETVELFRQYIENTPDNQRWHDVSIPLSDYAGQTVTLILTTEAGPAGDSTGDWAGWETPRLLYSVD